LNRTCIDLRRCQRLPGITSQLLNRSGCSFAFVDAPRRLLEHLRDFHIVLERGEASPEAWEQRVENFADAVVDGLAVGVEQPELSQALHRSPPSNVTGTNPPSGNDASVRAAGWGATALSGFGPDARSIG
jgi:hypothetical protein